MLYLLLPCDDFLIIIIIYHMIKLLCASRLEAEIMVRKTGTGWHSFNSSQEFNQYKMREVCHEECQNGKLNLSGENAVSTTIPPRSSPIRLV